ncbi:hypothetical protein PCA31118_01495 [Pandoraea captiosa]|uniref:Uncharacterized protein n=1 Tax=Pandoraea captiosa TaxID=2508302 RepID=A0A5E4ZVY3_9BURK|nr:hypothetical protein [Pandoraea captiosa]VVE64110.1 hypothetical protein PCA31118_01495 [Pandoraea captiosa]
MVADREYIERVRGYGWKDVDGLWRDVKQCSTPGWDAGKALEYLVLKGFELSGATVKWPYRVDFLDTKNVEQIDGVVYVANIAAMIECKDYSTPCRPCETQDDAWPHRQIAGATGSTSILTHWLPVHFWRAKRIRSHAGEFHEARHDSLLDGERHRRLRAPKGLRRNPSA